ncbi:MAG: DUF3604 domain-containing protein [Spirochaetales bacterium]|nr:DUF3604 domain-containing protein [Spirochaetales bacterium]
MKNIFWGDLHNHNGLGIGKGSLERSYSIALNTLDFYAFTPHGWWVDIPSTDMEVKNYHLKGFDLVKKNWRKIVAKANAMNVPGSFVAFIAYEWHSSFWGDYCVYFPGTEGNLYYAKDIYDLRSFVERNNAIMLPHHCAYKKGWRGTNWDTFINKFSPTAEIFSEHGNSLESHSYWGMYRHSMGGSDSSQTILAQLESGKHIGFTAGTDDHFGYPGSYNEGLTGIYAEELTRKDIIEAIKKRHSFAVTGDRIELRFNIDNAIMGDIVRTGNTKQIDISIKAQDEIDYIEIIKNGKSLTKWNTENVNNDQTTTNSLVRIEWGWDGIASKIITHWIIDIKTNNGNFVKVIPYFCGGPGIIEKENSIKHLNKKHLIINSYTSRSNSFPTQSAILYLESDQNTLFKISVKGKWGSKNFNRTISINKSNLNKSDVIFSITSAFSAPKLKLHRALSIKSLHFKKKWEDKIEYNDKNADFYFVKVLQKNGQMAWSSPIWTIK